MRIPSITDILKAAKTIRGKVRRTPLEYSHPLSKLTGGDVFLKLENQQRTNSFKIRGAMNKMHALSDEERRGGVVTASSGNHAQGLSLAASMLKVRAVIYVPETCPETKKASVLARGGKYVELRVVGTQYDDVERAALLAAEAEGLTFVSAYEDTDVAAGQGTLAIEILEEEPEMDAIFCPLSGGGLLTGVAVASRALRPEIELWGTFAENNPSWSRAWEEGFVVPVEEKNSLADALGGSASPVLFGFIRETINGIVPVPEHEIAKYMAWVHENHHIVIEGAAATAIWGVLSGVTDLKNRRVCAVISGGNVDDAKLLEVLHEFRT